MAYRRYERLSAIDATFLAIEDASVHMHVGAVAIFEGAPLRTAVGGIDTERIRAFIDIALHQAPRFRQKLAWVPRFEHPVWVDDPRFNLRYHVRHTALPPPGEIRQLKRMAARVFSQKLDRTKPLWEIWVVEGLEDGRFALVLKAHHCMVDGIAGIDILAAILRLEADATMPAVRPWIPQPPPNRRQLLRDEIWRRLSLPLDAVWALPRTVMRPGEVAWSIRESVLSVGEAIGAGLVPTTDTPLNADIGPYRRFDWTRHSIADLRQVAKAAGGKLNDVVLAAVAGAIRRFLGWRGLRLTPDTYFRALVPVSIRSPDEKGVPGNRVVNIFARLPVDAPSPAERLARTIATTSEAKRSRLTRGAQVLEELGDRTFSGLIIQFVRLAASQRTYNLVVTNVPGPPVPLYLLGARMTEIYPLVPLFGGQALGIALFSYDGGLHWGCNADWDAMPDLHDFVEALDDELHMMREAVSPASPGGATEPLRPNGHA